VKVKRQKATPVPFLMTLQQLHTEYGPPYTSLRDLVVSGTLPSVRLGSSKRIWVKRADFERLIETSTERGR